MEFKKSYLRIKPQYTVIPHSPNQVELRRGIWNPVSFTLSDDSGKGKLYSILNDLNGNNSVSEISKKYNISRADVESVIDQLHYLRVTESTPSTALDFYVEDTCSSIMSSCYQQDNALEKKILLIGDKSINNMIKNMLIDYTSEDKIAYLDANDSLYKRITSADDQWMYDSLQLEIVIDECKSWSDHFVVFTQDIVNPVVAARFNLIAHYLKMTWIHAAIDGPFVLVGPLFVPNNGPCYHCFEKRISMNLREHSSYLKYKQALINQNAHPHQSYPLHKPITSMMVSHLSMEVLNYMTTGSGFTRNKVLSFYLPTFEIVFNEVLRVASCPVCGLVEYRDNEQLYFDYQSLMMSDR